MSDENRAVVRRFMDEIIGQQDPAVFDEIVSPGVAAHRALDNAGHP